MHHIREATLADAGPWAGVVLEASPHMVLDERSEAHEMRTDPPDAHRFVAEVAGRVVGVARSRSYADEDHASLLVMVRPEHRQGGCGRALLDAVLDSVAGSGKARAVAIVEDDEASRIATESWGFSVTRQFQKAMVDPRDIPPPGPAAHGVTVVPLDDVGAEQVWQAHQRVARDDPSGLTLPMPWEHWQSEWSDPRARPDLGRAVLVDGDLAAYSMLGTAGDRAWSDMTGTLPEHRGRGLALLAKQHTLQAAAAAGITRAITGNDDANLPMLAVNRRLGYATVARPALAERALP
jgi:GNAT superfamily N-acetyltransferase